MVDARVYLGIPFRFADTAARKHGGQVADWVFDHFLLPYARPEQLSHP